MQIHKFVGGPYKTIGYLVCDGDEAVIIDVPMETSIKIADFAKFSNLIIGSILLTHVHWDHSAEAGNLSKIADSKVSMHVLDDKNQSEINSVFEGDAGRVKANRHIKEGDKITVGNTALEVLHTPGHTPGSACFYSKKDGMLFSGDTLFAGSYGRIDFPLGSYEDMKKSLGRLAGLPKETVVYPGHGPDTEIGKEKWLGK